MTCAPYSRAGRRRKFGEADKRQILEEAIAAGCALRRGRPPLWDSRARAVPLEAGTDGDRAGVRFCRDRGYRDRPPPAGLVRSNAD